MTAPSMVVDRDKVTVLSAVAFMLQHAKEGGAHLRFELPSGQWVSGTEAGRVLAALAADLTAFADAQAAAATAAGAKPTITADVARYRELSEPHASDADAETALDAFFAAVDRARTTHRIRDVVTCAVVNVRTAEGEAPSMAIYALGNANDVPYILAEAYGREKRGAEERLRAVLARAMRGERAT